MRKINKGCEPDSLRTWKRKNPNKKYSELDSNVRQDIRLACVKEQYFLCAYCCKEISGTNNDTMNEHVEPQAQASDKTLDFNNIVASCTTKGQCDDKHGSKILPLTPLMDECETELEFRLNGHVRGLTERAKEMIALLNLDNCKLQEARKQQIDNILLAEGLGNPIEIDDEELILAVLDDIYQADEQGKMLPFMPAVANAVRSWLANYGQPETT